MIMVVGGWGVVVNVGQLGCASTQAWMVVGVALFVSQTEDLKIDTISVTG